ncbi:RluA family pseudouridine synthase [Candidatus Gromoviella agglomerans]|uniref:RluA family pseudouridine synthase n=1 Tax=Candidatus Gromoviella agglomerans TaxID=2806609 RepID=UPI001E5C02B7|nr:RluA family pseudouridine synthase [Candidatus Gromoviella agglomerans]UFX98473.1 RluA family pseudouridine synthase [Candidatus Gromoviella agglomerans]
MINGDVLKFIVSDGDLVNGKSRLDSVLYNFVSPMEAYSHISRSQIQEFVCGGLVKVNDLDVEWCSNLIRSGDVISLIVPIFSFDDQIVPQEVPIYVVYEDEDILIINKQPGLVVHPAPGHKDSTLLNGLFHRALSLNTSYYLVHRLDKDTSGLIIIAKNFESRQNLIDQFVTKSARRLYKCFVHNVPFPRASIIQTNIGRHPSFRQKMSVLKEGGKNAVTFYRVLEVFSSPSRGNVASLVECSLRTGRTHQIRVHMRHIGCPIIGDSTYGYRNSQINELVDFGRQALHAYCISFVHPFTKKKLVFEADMPEDMLNVIEVLRSMK